MSEFSIYIDREDAKSVEEEERDIFIKSILTQVGVPLEEIWPDISLDNDQKRRLREHLSKLDIEIINIGNRETEIYHDDTLLGKWYKPRFILKKDLKARRASKRLFYEMFIKTWSVFEENDG